MWKKNETSTWPKTSYEELVEYLINSNAYDWKEMRAFSALCAYNYVQNGWLWDLYHFKFDSITYVICPAGLGRACSHISAVAYAISFAWMH